MELQDCAFPLLKEIHIGSDPKILFRDINYALLIGAKPRGPGMERGDLLKENGNIFVGQGKALNEVADRNVQVLVVGNPCNTNCFIAMKHAPNIPKENFHAMTRLDQNRAVAMVAEKAQVNCSEVYRMTIWGNHSSTQVPDATHVMIKNVPVAKVISDTQWFEKEMIPTVQRTRCGRHCCPWQIISSLRCERYHRRSKGFGKPNTSWHVVFLCRIFRQ